MKTFQRQTPSRRSKLHGSLLIAMGKSPKMQRKRPGNPSPKVEQTRQTKGTKMDCINPVNSSPLYRTTTTEATRSDTRTIEGQRSTPPTTKQRLKRPSSHQTANSRKQQQHNATKNKKKSKPHEPFRPKAGPVVTVVAPFVVGSRPSTTASRCQHQEDGNDRHKPQPHFNDSFYVEGRFFFFFLPLAINRAFLYV